MSGDATLTRPTPTSTGIAFGEGGDYNSGMNEAIAFDTHRFVKNLTESGFTEQQAEALAKEQVQLLNSNLATKVDILAIKADIETVKAELAAKIETVRASIETVKAELAAKIETVKANIEMVKAELEAKNEASKVDLLKWMVTAMVAQGTLIVGLVVAFVKLL